VWPINRARVADTPQTKHDIYKLCTPPRWVDGAPSRPRRLTLVVSLCISACVLLLSAAPALAAPLENPELKVEQIFATTATFKGVLSPKSLGEVGAEYQFVYRAAKACKGAGEIKTPAGMSLGGEHEELPAEPVTALKQKTEYTVCLSITNVAKTETAVSAPVSFKTTTATPPEAPEATEATEVKATTATLNGVVNQKSAGEPGKYQFIYRQSAGECTGAGEVQTAKEPAPGTSPQPVSAAITGLEAGKPYTFCVRAFNALGEATLSTPKTFKTAIPPEPPEAIKPEPVTGYSATLRGVLNPKAKGDPGTYQFRYRASATECEGEGEIGAPESGGAALGKKEEAVSATVTGLLPTTTYTFCLHTENEAKETAVSPPVTFTTPTAVPAITKEAVSTVGSSTAIVSAQVNPGGLPTTYHVDYGTSVAYGSTTPEASVGAGLEAARVQVQLSGLQPETLYHFRFVAANESGATSGSDVSFTTTLSAGATAGLPDGRVYELVSPVANQGGDVYVPFETSRLFGATETGTERPFRAAADGNAVAYVGDPSSTGSGSSGNGFGNQYLATRASGGGWSATDITPPASSLEDGVYQGFTSDLSVGVLTSVRPLTEGAPEGLLMYSYTTGDHSYHALETTPPPKEREVHLGYAGASADSTHILLHTNAALPSTPLAIDGGEAAANLYDAVAGQLRLVNVLPEGKPDPNATFGSPPRLSHVISADGSRIFWTDLNNRNLYVRENATKTVQVDASQVVGAGGGGVFQTATSDGSKAFFTDGATAQLTSDTAAESGVNLYEFDIVTGHLSDLTAAPHAEVQEVLGASADGSYVYFVSSAALAGENGESRSPSAGQPNLYLRHGGVTAFVATLSPLDTPTTEGFTEPLPAEVTPDGHHLVFQTVQSLTGYANNSGVCRQTGEIVPCAEIYVYNSDAHQVLCASCNPSGASPVAGPAVLEGRGLRQPYLPRWISGDGSRVFFDSSEPLVPQDVNRRQDVYEWEQQGIGGCQRSGGCVSLLSGGTSTDESYFVDASVSGNDVFFATRAQLVPEDQNGNVDLYDARVNGYRPLSTPACSGTGCQGVPPAPPSFATPSTVTFSGVGNLTPAPPPPLKPLTRAQKLAKALKACHSKRDKHKRTACERQARKRYGPTHKAKKSRHVTSRKGGK
jgi:Tol biopolymer transport system component